MSEKTALYRMNVQASMGKAAVNELDKFIEKQRNIDPDTLDWGDVGDMAHVTELLQQAVGFIHNYDLEPGVCPNCNGPPQTVVWVGGKNERKCPNCGRVVQ